MTKQKRHQGIDLMRIFCMLMIVLYHIQGHGGLINAQNLSPINQILIIAMQTIYQAAVDGYALISGYIGYRSHQKYSSLIYLWLRVLCYSVGITALVWLAAPSLVTWTAIRRSFFPLLNGQYWYFTAYAGCFVLTPLVHAAISNLSFKKCTLYLGVILVFFSFFPYIMRNDPFQTEGGNHALWLLILYALGMYIRKYDPFSKLSVKMNLLLLFGACAIQVSARFFFRPLVQLLCGKLVSPWYLICHDSPTTLLLALLLLLLFARISFFCNHRLFYTMASASFSVYLIHDHPLIRQHIIVPLGSRLAQLPSSLLLPSVFASALIIYLCATTIDFVREKIFGLLRIRSLISCLENKIHFSDET